MAATSGVHEGHAGNKRAEMGLGWAGEDRCHAEDPSGPTGLSEALRRAAA